MTYDRRAPSNAIVAHRCAGLTPAQQAALCESERLGWALRFVRAEQEGPLPVLFATEQDYFALRPDGSVILQPDIALRHIAFRHIAK